MELTDILVHQCDSLVCVEINGVEIPGVDRYKIKTSESGETEVILKIKVNAEIKSVTLSAKK